VKENQIRNVDHHAGRELETLQKGEVVRMKHRHEWLPAVVCYKHHIPRSYVVNTEGVESIDATEDNSTSATTLYHQPKVPYTYQLQVGKRTVHHKLG
jgi:hypothetical protein